MENPMLIQRNYKLCEALSRIQLQIITFGHVVLDECLRKPVRSCPFSRVYLILSGSFAVETAEGERFGLKEGEAYLIPAGARFEYICEEKTEYIFFHIKWCGFDQLDLLRRCRHEVCSLGEADWMQAALMALQKESQDPVDGIWLKTEIERLILGCVERYDIDLTEPKYSECTKRAITYIQKNLSMELQIDEIADAAMVARSTITRFFRNEVNYSILEYRYELIWVEACRLLSNGQTSVLKISEILGFSEQGFFSRQFFERFKIRPGRFRALPLI